MELELEPDDDKILHRESGMEIYEKNGKAEMYWVDIAGKRGRIGTYGTKIEALSYYRAEFCE